MLQIINATFELLNEFWAKRLFIESQGSSKPFPQRVLCRAKLLNQ